MTMTRSSLALATTASTWLAFERSAEACGTCSLDGGGGQIFMLVAMLSLPIVVAAIGYGAIRRLLSKLDAS